MAFKTIHKIKAVLANSEVAVQGATACIDRGAGASQGQAVAAQEAPDLIPIGQFAEDMTGDGSDLVEIELFHGKKVHFFLNDDTDAVDATDLLGPAYFVDGGAVGVPGDTSNHSLAGRVWVIESGRIGIETADSIGLQGPQGEQGEPGV
jgi:hypothetical protein